MYKVVWIISGNYASQAAITSSANSWNSTSSLATNTGLCYFNERLYYPTNSDSKQETIDGCKDQLSSPIPVDHAIATDNDSGY